MKAVVFDRFGPPEEVLQVKDVPEPGEPEAGQVRVRMLASPINPSDISYVRGQYGKRPNLPATPGFEGVGIVEAAGSGLLARRVRGKRVAVLNSGTGNWQEKVIIPAQQAIPVPKDLPDEQAAAFFVNPASALAMTQYVLKIPRGAWLIQTAAGSALGRMVIRLGRHYGFRTINVVRRREQGEELLKEGGDDFISIADDSIPDRVRTITNGQGVPFALDPVGGATGTGVLQSLGKGGRMLLYGTLSGEPIQIDPRVLIVGQKKVEGFWLSEWMPSQGIVTKLGLIRRIGKLFRQGIVTSEIGATFPLENINEAVKLAQTAARQGKILIRIG
ncbi:MAG TPA: zinc-dependent alcohol dehydrogenase family protein [Gemmataceae bacterium]|nr:zinc-dependent alcohol dehydrogenase family protein [Gemmataceae bacterium]